MTNVKELKQSEKPVPASLNEALFNVQQECPAITKETSNPYFKSKYADLPTIWGVIRPLMKVNKLFLSHSVKNCGDGEYLFTTITHVPTGDSITTTNKITLMKHTAQEYGSYMTYMRRYALTAMLGLVTDEDDDGNSATEAAKSQPPKAAKPVNPLKETADRIAKQLKDSQSAEVLTYVWDGFSKELDEIKAASPDKAFAALEKIYNDQLVTLNGGINE